MTTPVSSKQRLRRKFRKWAFFALGLSLLHLWLGMFSQMLSGQLFHLFDKLRSGALIFYANTLAVDVLRASWNERDFLIKNARFTTRAYFGSFGYELAGPLVVVILSVHTYSTLLTVQAPGDEYVWMQVGISLLAVMCSFNQAMITERRAGSIFGYLKRLYADEGDD